MLDGQPSEWTEVTSGVPQGSILGPLFFIMYVDDLGSGINSTTKLFANDCTLYHKILTRDDQKVLQQDVSTIYRWSQKWQLKLNISKCKSVMISNNRKPVNIHYHLNNSVLETVDKYKYLGVKISSKLLWNDHINDISLKAS